MQKDGVYERGRRILERVGCEGAQYILSLTRYLHQRWDLPLGIVQMVRRRIPIPLASLPAPLSGCSPVMCAAWQEALHQSWILKQLQALHFPTVCIVIRSLPCPGIRGVVQRIGYIAELSANHMARLP